jgi:hypothetical protein
MNHLTTQKLAEIFSAYQASVNTSHEHGLKLIKPFSPEGLKSCLESNNDPLRIAYVKTLESLTTDEFAELHALFLLGRGAMPTYTEAIRHARQIPRSEATGYLATRAQLDVTVRKGLQKCSIPR